MDLSFYLLTVQCVFFLCAILILTQWRWGIGYYHEMPVSVGLSEAMHITCSLQIYYLAAPHRSLMERYLENWEVLF